MPLPDATWPYVVIILVSVFVASVSQAMLKKAAMKTYQSFWQEYLNPLVIVAYILFFGTTLLALLAYKGIPLSLGPVLESTAYIYVTIFGVSFFKETLSLKKVLALCLVVLGILLFALG